MFKNSKFLGNNLNKFKEKQSSEAIHSIYSHIIKKKFSPFVVKNLNLPQLWGVVGQDD